MATSEEAARARAGATLRAIPARTTSKGQQGPETEAEDTIHLGQQSVWADSGTTWAPAAARAAERGVDQQGHQGRGHGGVEHVPDVGVEVGTGADGADVGRIRQRRHLVAQVGPRDHGTSGGGQGCVELRPQRP